MAPPDHKIPSFEGDFQQLADILKYGGFIARMEACNSEPIERPFMEECWERLCTEKAKYGEPKLAAAVQQMKGYDGFDVEKYWTAKAKKVYLERGVKLNVRAGNAEGKTTQKMAEEYGELIGAHPLS